MSPCKFAISVPIGAWHPFLPDCLASLALQGDHVEVAALDASGDPRVAETLDRFSDMLAYRRTGPDDGQSDAIIEGWRHTTAPYLGWLNADDALYPDALEIASKRLSDDPSIDAVYGDSTIIDDAAVFRGYHWAVRRPDSSLLRDCIISQPSCFFRRACVDGIGGLNRDLHYTMDWDLWVRLWRAGAKFDFVESVLSRVLWSREAKTGGFSAARRRELERIIGANEGALQKVKSRMGFALHHVMEYGAPRAVATAIRRNRAKQGRIINGIDRVGTVCDRGMMPLVYYGDGSVDGLVITLSGGATGHLSLAGERFPYNGGLTKLPLERPVSCGDVVTVEFTPSSRTYFEGAAWS